MSGERTMLFLQVVRQLDLDRQRTTQFLEWAMLEALSERARPASHGLRATGFEPDREQGRLSPGVRSGLNLLVQPDGYAYYVRRVLQAARGRDLSLSLEPPAHLLEPPPASWEGNQDVFDYYEDFYEGVQARGSRQDPQASAGTWHRTCTAFYCLIRAFGGL